jgi:hypothetical protein
MLRIRQDQIAPFEQDAIGKFVRRTIVHLRSELPDRQSGKSDREPGRTEARFRFSRKRRTLLIEVVAQSKLRAD